MPLKLMSAIISTPSAPPAFTEKEDAENLLKILLFYVKQCQARFGGKTELATEFDHNVEGLCCSLESVLSHGLRSKPLDPQQGSALRQVSDIVSNSLSFHNDTPVFWSFVKHHLTKHEQERYAVLRQIWTDAGRGKAWIRSALNERSLERYFHCLLSNSELLTRYYEDWALLCDQEKSAMLPNMAAGLGPILFAISIDKPELNNGDSTLSKLRNQSEPIISSESSAQKPELKKKKRVPAQIISFDDDEEDDKSCISYTSGSSVSQDKNIPSSSTNPSRPDTEMESSVLNDQKPKKNYIAECFPEVPQVSTSPGVSQNSFAAGSGPLPSGDVTLTPVQQTEIGELIPVATDVEQFSSESPESLDDAIEIPTDIVAVLTTVENKNKEEQNHLLEKIAVLTKENDRLKIRLKKYVSAVQMLKNDGHVAHRALADLSLEEEPETPADPALEAKIYEDKLVQVAEMHGELMEFNDHLQKVLGQKESHIQRLRAELSDLRGPLPSDNLSVDGDSYETVGLVSICVPSAFLTGSGSESHHVYQIYIRAGNDDWNIYRRYAQFYALHTELKKLDPAVTAFDFPPKKSLGNKDANLVEDRRRRLQTYLRKVLAHWPELGNCNSRYLLERHLSFFRDQPADSKKTNSKKGVFSSRRSNVPTNHENHYTGL